MKGQKYVLRMADVTIWGIHAGRTGDADTLFLKKNFIAIGWALVGDLGKLKPSREAFKAAVARALPDCKPAAVPNNAGQLFRFVHEMQEGDIVVYPSKGDRLLHLGRVDGSYRHDPKLESRYPNLRPVKWLRAVPRTQFSQGALYETGSAMSLFQLKNYADEFRAVLDNDTAPQPPPVKDDPTAAAVAEEIRQSTQDYVINKLAQELKGHPFAHFVANLLNVMGYRTRIAPEGPDGGVDIVAHKDELGFEPPIIKVQVKSTVGKVGDPDASALCGKVGDQEKGLLVTLGYFTPQARVFERSKPNLRLVDGVEFVELILAHYEQLDPKYKALLPLQRVYVPDPASAED
jgi:restriction system protein